jgi:histidine ammonia-lyase
MNSATDNPLVFCKEGKTILNIDGFEEDKLISAGNFHG